MRQKASKPYNYSNVNLRKAGYTFLYDEYVKWLP